MGDSYGIEPIGIVASSLADRATAPEQPDEGAPPAWLVLRPELAPALAGVGAGDRIVVITWFDRADRETLNVHPRGDLGRPEQGVFATRSPDRPNPVGLHEVTVTEVDGTRVRVDALEALDGTPIVDLKPVLERGIDEP